MQRLGRETQRILTPHRIIPNPWLRQAGLSAILPHMFDTVRDSRKTKLQLLFWPDRRVKGAEWERAEVCRVGDSRSTCGPMVLCISTVADITSQPPRLHTQEDADRPNASQSDQTRILTACGPFTFDKDLDYTPWARLATAVEKAQPSVLILVRYPFILHVVPAELTFNRYSTAGTFRRRE